MALLNLTADLYFLKGMAGWLVIDAVFYFLLVLAVVFGVKARDESASAQEKAPPALNRKGPTARESFMPPGYTGPFWNKPSTAYLEDRARASIAAPSNIAPFLLLVPFVVLFYLLLRH